MKKIIIKDSTKIKSVAKRTFTVMMSAVMIAGFMSGCNSNKTNDSEDITNSIETEVPEGGKEFQIKREDGAYLQFLVSYNYKTKESSINLGYITYDKNGVYFYDAINERLVKLDNPSVFEYVNFYAISLSFVCSSQSLFDNTVSEAYLNTVIKNITIEPWWFGQSDIKAKNNEDYQILKSIDLYLLKEKAEEGKTYTYIENYYGERVIETTYKDQDNIKEPTKSIGEK